MTVVTRRRCVRFLGVAAELSLVVGVLLSFRALFAYAAITNEPATIFLPSSIWWVASWSCLRFSVGIASLLSARPALWFLPILAGLWELKIFAGVITTTLDAMSSWGIVSISSGLASLCVVFGHFWIACLAPVVLVPVLALQAWWLFEERDCRARRITSP